MKKEYSVYVHKNIDENFMNTKETKNFHDSNELTDKLT